MPAETLPIQVPSEDPKKKNEKKESEDVKKAKANGEKKEGEDLVCLIDFATLVIFIDSK